MELTTERLQYLWERYLDRTATHPELQELMDWLEREEDALLFQETLEPLLSVRTEGYESLALHKDYVSRKVKERMSASPQQTVHRVFSLPKWSWAAAAMMLVLGGWWLSQKLDNKTQNLVETAHLTMDIPPGKEGAILTLSDGTQVVLDSLSDGLVAAQNGSQVQLKNGAISYDITGNLSSEMVYNIISTPKGRQFHVTLPDGTKVWLNAASSIQFPTIFTEKERKVFVTGEAYFEVAQNAKQPFLVNINNKAEVDVLGTQFNINAYENEESLNTTLLEGSIKVSTVSSYSQQPTNNIIIKPGQQVQIAMSSYRQRSSLPPIKVINNADTDKVIAWKNGAFNFDGASLKEAMKQLERWYDIEVIYESVAPDIKLKGKMTRGVTLNGLLNVLMEIGIKCRLEGRQLVVLP